MTISDISEGYVMIVDMYYYYKKLRSRWKRFKKYQRKGILLKPQPKVEKIEPAPIIEPVKKKKDSKSKVKPKPSKDYWEFVSETRDVQEPLENGPYDWVNYIDWD